MMLFNHNLKEININKSNIATAKTNLTYNIYYIVISITIVAILVSLSYWQYKRGKYKQELLQQQHELQKKPPININELEKKLLNNFNYEKLRFTNVKITGSFTQQDFLIDNQVHNKIVGFRVLSLFKLNNKDHVLIDRGFINRQDAKLLKYDSTNNIPNSSETITISGVINQPATGILLKEDKFDFLEFPIILQNVNYKLIIDNLKINLLPITIQPNQGSCSIFQHIECNSNINPSKHFSYAWQWFILAIISFIYSLIKYFR